MLKVRYVVFPREITSRLAILMTAIAMLATQSHGMNPVYSAQASGNFNNNPGGQNSNNSQNGSNQPGNNFQNGNFQNGNSQNGNYQGNNGNNNYNNQNNQNGYSNNNGAGGYNTPTTLNNSNNGAYSTNNPGQNGYNQNNNGYNNNGNYNNGYNNTGNSSNNQNVGNNQNSNFNNGQPNVFTENYALKGRQFTATVYRKDGNGRLYKTTLGSNDLQRAIIIFFGDWCPHCARFLGNFSKNMSALTQAGVKIVFIGVPSIDGLQNWREPTDADFNNHLQKLNSFGIQVGNNSELVLLGDKASLNSNAVDSLPTMMAVSNGKECFRGGADNSIERVEFTNQDAIGQFLQVFNSFGNQERQNQSNNTPQLFYSNNNYKTSKTRSYNKVVHNKQINADRTNVFTEMLNNDCNLACAVKKWAPPVTYATITSCPPCPACPVCPQCSAPVTKPAEYVIEGNYTAPHEPDTCTTCGCKLKRALSKRCGTSNKSKKKNCKVRRCCKRQH